MAEQKNSDKAVTGKGGDGSPAVEIFCDGACSGNPGPGGYGTILRFKGVSRELSGADPVTTNNRMELTAALVGLKELKRPCQVTVTTDSQYLVKGMTEWIPGWIRNNWKNSKKEPVVNRDLWEALLDAVAPHKVQWQWVRGHNGHAENERCDQLARLAIRGRLSEGR